MTAGPLAHKEPNRTERPSVSAKTIPARRSLNDGCIGKHSLGIGPKLSIQESRTWYWGGVARFLGGFSLDHPTDSA